jgi:hypothetical protein
MIMAVLRLTAQPNPGFICKLRILYKLGGKYSHPVCKFLRVSHSTHPDYDVTRTGSALPRTIYPILFRNWIPVVACIFFILFGLAFIPAAGIQNDEALFSSPIYSRLPHEFRIRPFHHDLPLMLLSYLGTLKTLLYTAVFALWKPTVWSVRVPTLLAGALSVWVFWKLLDRASGRFAAIAGCTLLACDSAYLLTTVFDWGPVALQHLLLLSGAVLVLAFAQDHSRIKLGCGFFLFGLGMWDKALFSWTLGGLLLATLTIFPRQAWSHFTRRNVLIAALSFATGALPLIIYNVRSPLQTFRGNARFSTEDLGRKAALARHTLDGSSLFGYLVAEDWTEQKKQPRTPIERASIDLRNLAGVRQHSIFFWALLISILLVPVWRKNWRVVSFGLIFLLVAWVQMAFTKDAGGGVHHVILLWPFPQFVVAVVLGELAARFRRGPVIAWTCLSILCVSNLLVVNQYFAQFVTDGAMPNWSDAITPLATAVQHAGDRDIYVMDWGMFDTLRMMGEGRFRLGVGSDAVEPAADPHYLKYILERPSPLFLSHTKETEVFTGVNERLRSKAAALGYRQKLLRTITDSNGRAVFEISEFSLVNPPRSSP